MCSTLQPPRAEPGVAFAAQVALPAPAPAPAPGLSQESAPGPRPSCPLDKQNPLWAALLRSLPGPRCRRAPRAVLGAPSCSTGPGRVGLCPGSVPGSAVGKPRVPEGRRHSHREPRCTPSPEQLSRGRRVRTCPVGSSVRTCPCRLSAPLPPFPPHLRPATLSPLSPLSPAPGLPGAASPHPRRLCSRNRAAGRRLVSRLEDSDVSSSSNLPQLSWH